MTLPAEPPRYALLETARYFALDRLREVGELDSAKGHMAAAMLQVLDAAYSEYWSLDEAIWVQRHGAELENVRTAIDWATAHDPALAVALYGSAWPMFAEMELFAEARARFDQTVGLLVDALPRARLARFWEAVATYDSNRQFDRARHAADLAAALHGQTGDVRSRYYALMQLALNWRGDDDAARAAFVEAQALEDAAWPARLLTQGALTQGALLLSAGKFVEARSAYRRAVHLALTVSERQALAATVNIVELDLACGDTAAALQLGRPLSLSLRQSGRRAAHFDLLAVMFGALLLAGETDEARATAAELHDLAVRLDPGKLYKYGARRDGVPRRSRRAFTTRRRPSPCAPTPRTQRMGRRIAGLRKNACGWPSRSCSRSSSGPLARRGRGPSAGRDAGVLAGARL